MARTAGNISSTAVGEATGRTWDEWLELLDEAAGPDADHRTLVAAVADAGVENAWWQQQIAVGYNHRRDGQLDGENPNVEFEIGIQRTIPVDRETLWTYLVDDGFEVWLGEVNGQFPAPNIHYETTDGTTGEVRTIADGERIRLTWQPNRLDDPATLQLTLSCPPSTDDRTTLRVHLEKLPDATAREDLRTHWQAVLDRIQADLTR